MTSPDLVLYFLHRKRGERYLAIDFVLQVLGVAQPNRARRGATGAGLRESWIA